MKKLFVIIAALALVWAFAAPASAVDWNFYGSARMATYYTSDDFGDSSNAAGTDDEDDGTQWELQSNSRLGATVKGETVRGRFELGLKGLNGGDIDVGTRRIFGTWNFGAGTLKVGKDYTPVNQFISASAFATDNGLLGFGAFYGRRPGQISLSFGRLEIALIDPDGDNLIFGLSTVAGIGGGDPDSYLPKIEAGWGMSFDQFSFNLMGGFQYYEIEDVVSSIPGQGTDDVEVISWVVGADASFSFGPAYIKGAASFSQNPNDAQWATGAFGGAVWDGDDDTDDTDVIQASLVAGWKMSDMITFEIGGGVADYDTDGNTVEETTQWQAYLMATIQLAPGVWIIPEVGFFDFDDDQFALTSSDDDAGDQFYLGAKWQIDF